MKKRQKGFYTLEATWMFGLALVIFVGVILLTIRIYGETYDDIMHRQPEKIMAVSEFRKINMAKDLAGRLKNDGNGKEE